MNPFDIKAALLAKHAQHVVLIHFPIALFLAGVAFELMARWTKRSRLQEAAYFNLLAAAASTPPVLVTGLLAWRFQLEGEKLKGILLLHLALGIVSSAMIGLVGWLHFRARRNDNDVPNAYVSTIEIATASLLILTAHAGGYLSGVNVPG